MICKRHAQKEMAREIITAGWHWTKVLYLRLVTKNEVQQSTVYTYCIVTGKTFYYWGHKGHSESRVPLVTPRSWGHKGHSGLQSAPCDPTTGPF